MAACGAASNEPSPGERAPEAEAAQSQAPTLYGRWIITAINGSVPRRFASHELAVPALLFSPSRYGGTTGCNSFGGTGLLVGDRWFGEPPVATQQGCAELEAQERAIIGIVAGGPVVTFPDAKEARLTTKSGSLRLRRDARAGTPAQPQPDPMLLAGTAWEVITFDGAPLDGASGRRRLTFEADEWALSGRCGPLSGTWRQKGRGVTMAVTSPPPSNCSPVEAERLASLRTLFGAAPHHVVGPNRELVMAGGGHWLTGQFDRSLGRDDKALLKGEWRIDVIDGAAPSATHRPASLIFGNASYAVWNGCNHSEGVFLTYARQLFTRGSGLTTLADCQPDPLRNRIGEIVGGHPRIAKTASTGLALVSPAGTLRLTRLSRRGFGTSEELGLRPPREIDLLEPKARLTLENGNFSLRLGCGRIEGDWRAGQPARFSAGPIERTAANCDAKPGSDVFRLMAFFTGNVLAVTGPNRDIVLLVNEGRSLAGRVPD